MVMVGCFKRCLVLEDSGHDLKGVTMRRGMQIGGGEWQRTLLPRKLAAIGDGQCLVASQI